MILAGLPVCLRRLGVYAALRLCEAHNKVQRLDEEVQLVPKEMQQYLQYCRNRLGQVAERVCCVKQQLAVLAGAVPTAHVPVKVCIWLVMSTVDTYVDTCVINVLVFHAWFCRRASKLLGRAHLDDQCSRAMQATGRYELDDNDAAADQAYLHRSLAKLMESKAYYGALMADGLERFRNVLGNVDITSGMSRLVVEEHVDPLEEDDVNEDVMH